MMMLLSDTLMQIGLEEVFARVNLINPRFPGVYNNYSKILVEGSAPAITAEAAITLPTTPPGGASCSGGRFGYGRRGDGGAAEGALLEWWGCIFTKGIEIDLHDQGTHGLRGRTRQRRRR